MLDAANSPPHCAPARVRGDLRAALDWYRMQAASIAATRAYPPTYSAELAQYYTGDLLHETRETVYANQQAGRVVYATWHSLDSFSAPQWAPDGRSATLTVRVREHRTVIEPPPSGEMPPLSAGSLYETWQFTVAYDAASGQWKIMDARALVTR